jgi:2-desacetyl-2-hydroxyethyl bacteriochlorophyllide A dehydrogenase
MADFKSITKTGRLSRRPDLIEVQSETMHIRQALVCLEPGQLSVEVRDVPPRGAGEVLVRPRRIGICGTDYHIFEGKHPFLQYPRIMGHELAVEVLEAPEGSGLNVGEICAVNPYIACGTCSACRKGKPNCCTKISVLGVHADGGMADLLVVPAANLIRAPGLSVDECAAVEFLAIGAHAVRRGAVQPGERVLIVGTGPIGLGVALFARIAGGQVAVYDRDPERVAAARAITGADALPDGADVMASALAYTEGDSFDVVFDATGTKAAMEKGFDFVGHGGRYVLVSVVKDPITFLDSDFHRKEMTLLGSRNATSVDFEHVMASMRAGKVPLDKLITHRTTLTKAVSDLPYWASVKSGLVKAVIEV